MTIFFKNIFDLKKICNGYMLLYKYNFLPEVQK